MAKRFQLAPYVRVGTTGDRLFLGFGSIQQIITDPRLNRVLIEIAAFLKQPRTENEVIEFLQKHIPSNLGKTPAQILSLLHDGGYLIEEDMYQPDGRYSRHFLFYNMYGVKPPEVQDRLRAKRVLLLGCGGIGNLVSVLLATAGIGELILMDADAIELSNLTRQILFTEGDIGKPKTQTLAQELASRNKQVTITRIERGIAKPQDLEHLPECDLLVLSADKPVQLVKWVNSWAIQTRTPFVNVGYIQDVAVWGPFVIPGQTGCWECQTLVANPGHAEQSLAELMDIINRGYQAPSVGPVNMLASSLAALDILKFFGGFGQIQSADRRVGVWTHDLRIEFQNCQLNKDCKVCSLTHSLPSSIGERLSC